MKQFQGTLDSLEELALQNIFDDIFDIPSSNYLLEGKEPVEGFSSNEPLWPAQRIIYALTHELRQNAASLEVTAALLGKCIRSEPEYFVEHHNQISEIIEKIATRFKTSPRILFAASVFTNMLNKGTGNFSDSLNKLIAMQDDICSCEECLVAIGILLRDDFNNCADSLQIRWNSLKAKDGQPENIEALKVLNLLAMNRIPVWSSKGTQLFAQHIKTKGDLSTLISCHRTISPHQISLLVRVLLRLMNGDKPADSNQQSSTHVVYRFHEIIGTGSLLHKLEKEKLTRLHRKSDYSSIERILHIGHKHFEASLWSAVSPTFLAFLNKARMKGKSSLFFKTLMEEAKGILTFRSTQGQPIGNLSRETIHSLSILSTLSEYFSEHKKALPQPGHSFIAILALTCYCQATSGERIRKESFNTGLSVTKARELLNSESDIIPLGAYDALLGNHKIINDIIESSRGKDALKSDGKDNDTGLTALPLNRQFRIRAYYLNSQCPSPSLLYMALKDVALSSGGVVSVFARNLIMNNLAAFARMSSLMLAKAKGKEIEEIISFLSFFNGHQIIAIIEPYLSKLIKEKPSATGRFLLTTLPIEMKLKVEATATAQNQIQDPCINTFLTVAEKLTILQS